MAGLFLVIEGPEGAGKSTLARGLARRLAARGLVPVEVREPGGTPLAEAARAAFLDPALEATPLAELFLLLAARADLVARVIRPALAEGKAVVCDRYDLSTTAYQVAGRGLDAAAVASANRLATGGLMADLTLVLDVPPAVGRTRQEAAGKVPDRVERADPGFHERVAAAFRAAEGPGVVHVDGTAAAAAVEAAAWEVVRQRCGKHLGSGRVE